MGATGRMLLGAGVSSTTCAHEPMGAIPAPWLLSSAWHRRRARSRTATASTWRAACAPATTTATATDAAAQSMPAPSPTPIAAMAGASRCQPGRPIRLASRRLHDQQAVAVTDPKGSGRPAGRRLTLSDRWGGRLCHGYRFGSGGMVLARLEGPGARRIGLPALARVRCRRAWPVLVGGLRHWQRRKPRIGLITATQAPEGVSKRRLVRFRHLRALMVGSRRTPFRVRVWACPLRRQRERKGWSGGSAYRLPCSRVPRHAWCSAPPS